MDQVITLMTTNGQAPFLSVFMYLGEAKTPHEKHDLAMIIEETLKQRILGVKNEASKRGQLFPCYGLPLCSLPLERRRW